MVGRWLLKTEPEEWSWEHQQANGGISHWDGVRNAQAQKHLRAMEQGDLCLFYHSGAKAKEIVGIARVCKPFYPDPSDASNKHVMVDIEAVSKLLQPLALSRLKEEDGLGNFLMFRQPRLSVVPVSSSEWKLICELAGQLEPPPLLDKNGDFRVDVDAQALKDADVEVKTINTSRGFESESSPFLDRQNANVSVRVRVRTSDQTAKCVDETTDALPEGAIPSHLSPTVGRRPQKPKSKSDTSKAKLNGSFPPSDKDANDRCTLHSDSIQMRPVKIVPDAKRVYSRRSRNQEQAESLNTNADMNDSRGMASANAGRVYKRRKS